MVHPAMIPHAEIGRVIACQSRGAQAKVEPTCMEIAIHGVGPSSRAGNGAANLGMQNGQKKQLFMVSEHSFLSSIAGLSLAPLCRQVDSGQSVAC